jgi:hypothetical protein
MPSASDDVSSFAALLEQRLRAVQTSSQNAAGAFDSTAESNPDSGAIEKVCLLLKSKARERSPGPDLEAPRANGRPFERLRALTEAAAENGAAGLLSVSDDDGSSAVLPLDYPKTFVGANGTHYDECWRLMEWRGSNRSWNWAAALTLGGWLAYRRFYGYALLHSAWLGLLLLLAANGAPIPLLASLQVAVALALGLYGNTLYRRLFRKAAMVAAQHDGDHPARLALLAAAGGVDSRAAWIMGLAMVVLTALILWFGRSIGGIGLPL